MVSKAAAFAGVITSPAVLILLKVLINASKMLSGPKEEIS